MGAALPSGSEEFPLTLTFARIERAIAPFPRATLFELQERGYGDVYSQLVACLLSVRTLDEVSLKAALRVLERAPSARALTRVPEAELLDLVVPCTFARQKTGQLLALAAIVAVREPRTREELLALPGIGPKCANLVLGIALGVAAIGVDIHVHRVTNRWGFVAAGTPERTEAQLREKLPRRYWVRINELLVPFGKHICTGVRPRCSTCPVREWCARVGVRNPR